jgi:Ca-activated chloride channel family protein
MKIVDWGVLAALVLPVAACGQHERKLAPKSKTWAELRVVRHGVHVTLPGGKERAPYLHERLVDGEAVRLDADGLAWLRRDGGATLLVRGPASLKLYSGSVELDSGRVFVDAPRKTELVTLAGPLHLSKVRSSIDVTKGGATSAYVLAGEVRAGDETRARAGELLTLAKGARTKVAPELVWEDWTGGLAITDRVAEPAPFGVGTVGGREPGSTGKARFPLAIQHLDVHVTIDGEFALTEVDERFFNSSSNKVEGIYRFRTPSDASLSRFGVDRDGKLAWGRVKEKQAAATQYQSNVYQGSTEDPALLEWQGPGEYAARLYPIGPGETRRVVVRYTQWLGRTGPKGERREYVYPMAAEGSEASLPHIEELTATIDVGRARASEIRVGMDGVREGNTIVVKKQDFVPRADLAVELFDGGKKNPTAYRAKHQPDLEVLPPDERADAVEKSLGESDYVLVPVRARDVPLPRGGLDLAIVVDASAANEPASMALARAATGSLLAHLSKDDRVVVWAGAEELRPVVPDMNKLASLDDPAKRRVLASLATLDRGGATDLGTMLTEAAASLDPKRRSAVIYVGDGHATVGELSLEALKKRLAKLPHPVRLFALGVGASPDMSVLSGLAAGGFARRVDSGYAAARASLSVFEQAERPALLGTAVDLGQNVERVYPRDPDALVADETVLVVGRVKGSSPDHLVLQGPAGKKSVQLDRADLDDHGDLRRRWAGARLGELLRSGAGRAAMVDLGTRYGIITPVTSLYVPTRRELEQEDSRLRAAREAERRRAEDKETEEVAAAPAEDKQGGTGTRAKGEEGSMGIAAKKSANHRYAVQGPKGTKSRAAALHEAQQFGMIGSLDSETTGKPSAAQNDVTIPKATAQSAPAPEPTATADRNAWGHDVGGAFGAGGLGLSGIGPGGGGRGDGIGLGNIGTQGHGTGTGQGFGSGHGRVGGDEKTQPPRLRMGATTVSGKLPAEVIQRIVRQNYGRFRMCYQQGLEKNPNLEGKVAVRFVIGRDGSVSHVGNGGSDLPDSGVVGCVVRAYNGLSFPPPPDGIVTVVYPIKFSPGDYAAEHDKPASPKPSPLVRIDVLPRWVQRCGPGANIPLVERIGLWRERLARAGGDPAVVRDVYRHALGACEAPTWAERRRLLSLMLDALPSTSKRVALWRSMFDDRAEADTLYRGLVARVKTPAQMRELHQALGLKSLDPQLLAKYLRDAKTPEARVAKMRALVQEWPDDFDVALALLDALEDAGDRGGARDLAEHLRARPDIDAHVRTEIGELYLRLSATDKSPADKKSDLAAGRRAFGEIVEFAPEDPVARRRLGDLLRAHGWYAEAQRQYETLAELAPDDASVTLLFAAAAQGQGQLEAAVRWLEKAEGGGAPAAGPDRGPAGVARALAATYLAWGRLAARQSKNDKELAALVARATRVLSDQRTKGSAHISVRVSLTWAHPELHPTLWSNALGSDMPAPEGDVAQGIAQVRVPRRAGIQVEVRLDPEELARTARLGAQAVLTVVFDELGKHEKIVKLPVKFERGGPSTLKFDIGDGEVIRG